MDGPTQNRITSLEETVAHQSQTIDDLSAQLAAQWTQIDRMQLKLDRLAERFLTLEEASIEAPANTRPPHY